MAVRMNPVDVVLVGGGLTAAILGKEIAEAGHRVVALERGQMRQTVPDFQSPNMHDELKYDVRNSLAQDVSVQTISFRNFPSQRALPMRQLGSFLPGEGVGGGAVHWNGQTWRFQPEWFELRSWVNERYGEDFLDQHVTIQDWGVTYEELEPYYTFFEQVMGIGGLPFEGVGGGNPFEGPRSAGYPNPPNNYIGLDPTYTGAFGQPFGMITYDFPCSDRLMAWHITQKVWKIAEAMGGSEVSVGWLDDHYSIVPYQTTHNTGGAIMGTDPATSVVNRHLQSWDLHNLWVMGSSVFPQNAGYNPTATIGALAYRAAETIVNDYLRNPRPLT